MDQVKTYRVEKNSDADWEEIDAAFRSGEHVHLVTPHIELCSGPCTPPPQSKAVRYAAMRTLLAKGEPVDPDEFKRLQRWAANADLNDHRQFG